MYIKNHHYIRYQTEWNKDITNKIEEENISKKNEKNFIKKKRRKGK